MSLLKRSKKISRALFEEICKQKYRSNCLKQRSLYLFLIVSPRGKINRKFWREIYEAWGDFHLSRLFSCSHFSHAIYRISENYVSKEKEKMEVFVDAGSENENWKFESQCKPLKNILGNYTEIIQKLKWGKISYSR